MEKWRGKVAVVTGASAGIGVALVKALCKHGINVIGLARRAERVEVSWCIATKKALESAGVWKKNFSYSMAHRFRKFWTRSMKFFPLQSHITLPFRPIGAIERVEKCWGPSSFRQVRCFRPELGEVCIRMDWKRVRRSRYSHQQCWNFQVDWMQCLDVGKVFKDWFVWFFPLSADSLACSTRAMK